MTKNKPKATDTLVFDDPQLIKWLEDKDKHVAEGREVSKELETVQKRIDELLKEEDKLTAAVKPKELIDKGNKLTKEINKQVEELEKISAKIREEKLKAIPKEMEKEHLELNDKREKLEQKRNKIALKVQKIKDRFIPKLQMQAKKHLGEFEDLMTAELKDGKLVVEKFSHLQEWKRQYAIKNTIGGIKKKRQ